jgi:23S rRNA pseudouridine1911/1915/1917 synthase
MPERAPLKPRHISRANGAEIIEVPPYGARLRLDAFLAKYGEGRSRTEWQRLIEDGVITLDGKQVRPSDRLAAGQKIQVIQAQRIVTERPQASADIPLTIVYQDPSMIVVNKPPGLVVHPAPGHADGTLVNALLARFPELSDPSGEQRPGIVHRLDKDTSGLLVIGRTTAAMGALQAQFKERTASKKYLLLVQGDLAEEEAAIEVPIGRDVRDRKRMAATTGGRESRTQFVVLERYGDFTLVEADLQSGRTHQLRVHFQFIGHPVAGDRTYGGVRGPSGLRRQFVHACTMTITSPHDGVSRTFHAPLPGDLRSPLERHRIIRGFASEPLPAVILGGDNPPDIMGNEIVPVPGQPRRNAPLPVAPPPDARPVSTPGIGTPRSPSRPRGLPSPAANSGTRTPPWKRMSATARPKRGPRP